MYLATLIRCWQLTAEFHSFNPGATEAEIVSVEQELGLDLPETLRELYRFSDGLDLFGGQLDVYPLRTEPNNLSLSRVTPWLRECHWPIPETVLV
ncbi:MAG: SMI1/KNR4 family protein [Acidobacteriota bacterium]